METKMLTDGLRRSSGNVDETLADWANKDADLREHLANELQWMLREAADRIDLLEGIARDVAKIESPYHGVASRFCDEPADIGYECFFCGVREDRGVEHLDSCAWVRANAAIGGA